MSLFDKIAEMIKLDFFRAVVVLENWSAVFSEAIVITIAV